MVNEEKEKLWEPACSASSRKRPLKEEKEEEVSSSQASKCTETVSSTNY